MLPEALVPSHGPQTAASVTSYLAQPIFYCAHRGSGMEFPEHTMAAYDAIVACGAQAIEVSVNLTADGVPVCMHDPTLDRTTNSTGPVLGTLYAGLSNTTKVQPAAILGQGWQPQPLPTLRDVLDRFIGRVVIFLEGKTNEATIAVQKMLADYYPTANQSVIWKAYFQSPTFPLMKSRGFTTWGYVDDGTTNAQLDAADANIDMWGVPHTMAASRMAEIVSRGKPVMCWEVHRRSQHDQLIGLGVRGMMCAQYQWITNRSKQIIPNDTWKSATKAPGEMGRTYYSGVRSLKYSGTGEAFMDVTKDAVLAGAQSFPEFPTNGYRITYDMLFEAIPATNEHAGIAFGKADDSPYQFGLANTSGGYHVCFRGNGDLQLFSHQPNVTNGTQLASASSTAPKANTWMSFQVDITPAAVTLTRTDVTPNVSVTTADKNYRGGYLHLSAGSVAAIGNRPRWRNLKVTAL
ncbi:glycerophosphodiester phosphodiesterase [Streptomyces sp. Tu6071]|uniref:glycerophosphodiester phosphodiesterase n=1 Tax=Streptomyces sp. Tu6071 TaxID=355249 RepID=UPI002277324A|nr:glycerophosphodiester phosphodiesterase [Streptomyces sp. Tu6071]